jgi:hypothetical protein
MTLLLRGAAQFAFVGGIGIMNIMLVWSLSEQRDRN